MEQSKVMKYKSRKA